MSGAWLRLGLSAAFVCGAATMPATAMDNNPQLTNMPNSVLNVIQKEGELSDKDFANMMSVNKKMHKKIEAKGQLQGVYDGRKREKHINELKLKLNEISRDRNALERRNELTDVVVELVTLGEVDAVLSPLRMIDPLFTEKQSQMQFLMLCVDVISRKEGFAWIQHLPILNLVKEIKKAGETISNTDYLVRDLLDGIVKVYVKTRTLEMMLEDKK